MCVLERERSERCESRCINSVVVYGDGLVWSGRDRDRDRCEAGEVAASRICMGAIASV